MCGDSTAPGIGVPAVVMSGHICANNIMSVPEHWQILVGGSEQAVWTRLSKHLDPVEKSEELRIRSRTGPRSWKSDLHASRLLRSPLFSTNRWLPAKKRCCSSRGSGEVLWRSDLRDGAKLNPGGHGKYCSSLEVQASPGSGELD